MKNIIKIFFNIIFTALFLLSVLILYSENTSTLNHKISHNIEKIFLANYSINSNIESIQMKWEGINPNILIYGLKLNDKKNNVILNTPASIIKIDLLKSLYHMTYIINEVIINNTTVSLIRDNSNIYINDLNLINKSKKANNTLLPRIVLKNSIITLKDKSTNNNVNFKINTLITSHNNDALNIDASFLHKSSLNPITLIYRGTDKENNYKSKVYLSGNSVKLPYELLPISFQQIKSDRISFRVWMDLTEMRINSIKGNIAANTLDIKLTDELLKIRNVNSDILYAQDKISETLSLTRLNYQVNNEKINNNKIVISKNKSKEIKVFVEKSSKETIKILSKKTSLFNDDYFAKLENPVIRNLQIHTHDKDILNYFMFTVESSLLKLNKKYELNDISIDVYGNLKKGKIQINSLSLDNRGINYIKKLNGSLIYNIRGKSIYFSSNNLRDKNGHSLLITGKKISKYASTKIELTGNLKDTSHSLYPQIEKDDLEISGNFNSNIYYHNGRIFGKTQVSKTYINKADSIYFSADKINLYHSSKMIKSNKFIFNINNQKQTSNIDTKISPKSHKYILTSLGEVEANVFSSLLELDNIIDGKSLVKSNITYDKKNDSINIFASSDLKGISVSYRETLMKKTNDKLYTTLNYQYSTTESYPIKLSINKYDLEVKKNLDYFYIKINSPAARGFLKYPRDLENNDVLSGSFEYIDTNYFGKGSLLTSIPKINIKSKYLKSNNIIFDNFHLIMKPMSEYIEITTLNFKNTHLAMRSSGKWYINNEMNTELLADIESDNFGLALKTLGYPSAIRGGKLQAKLSGTWSGSIRDFSFSNTTGNLNFTIKEGQINELDKGTQAIGQVLGLFSISSIPKRLSLDFSDFFSTGLSFDDINTQINLNSGIANTKKMVITGSFGEMRLSGKSDLINKTHDQVLIFIPDLSSTSLVTGAVIGGPIGAAASIFYDRLLKEFGVDTNKLAGIEYSIKGPWKDPKIKVTQSFKPILN